MTAQKISFRKISPVLLTFIVMGFVDIVGVSTGYVQKDFELSDTLAQFIPFMVFIWFFVFSIPVGIIQDKIGKKRMMHIGLFVTFIGLMIPFIHYSFISVLIAFVGIGIGNTIIQVAANPLLQEVIFKEKLSSFLSLSQFIKAITSLLGPIIATSAALAYGDWKWVFVVYAIVTLISILWLYSTKIEEQIKSETPASFRSCMKLLTNKFVLAMVIAIFLIVGADVGMNSNIQGFLMKLHGFTLEKASYGISIYFTALMISRFAGAILLQFLKPQLFLVATTILALVGMSMIMLSTNGLIAQIAIFIVGLGAGNLFPIIFSIAINKMPSRSNEISGLLVMSIVGGALVPPIMGAANTHIGIMASLVILVLCFAYMLL
ncbi:MFS transporter, partial [uncultured Wocania sp.]|uniref:MFS transporter n=1 Tax=uncultured Wocania sp. TaxID=2834404 RepID=UPI0030F681D2